MPRRSRVRRIAKWIGAVLVVVWVISYCVSYENTSLGWRIGSCKGWIEGKHPPDLFFNPLFLRAGGYESGWLPAVRTKVISGDVAFFYGRIKVWQPQVRFWHFSIPFWLPFLVVALPIAYLFRRDRRHPRGHCQACGYDLAGNVSGVCPECGATP